MRHPSTFLALILLLVGCSTLGSVRPGEGRESYFRNMPAQRLWEVTKACARQHLDVAEVDESRRFMRAQKSMSKWSWGEVVGITVADAGEPGDSLLQIDIQRRYKMNVTARDWEPTIRNCVRDTVNKARSENAGH